MSLISPSVTRSFQQSPNYTKANRSLASITALLIHWWNVPSAGSTHGGVVSWFLNKASKVSAHYVISAGRLTQQVKEKDVAWHAGPANPRSIGLELSPYCTEADYQTAAETIADIWRRAGRIIPLQPHRQHMQTACPGDWDLAKLHRMALTIYRGTSIAPAAPKPAPAKPAAPKPAAAPAGSYADRTTWPERPIQQRINDQLWEDNAYDNTKFALVEALRRAGYGTESVTSWGRLQQVSRWLRGRHNLRGPETAVEIWKRFQTFLKSVNRYAGAIDGIPGPQTTRGIFGWLNDIRSAYL